MLWNEPLKIFEPDAARTLWQKFYVDNKLKSSRGICGAVDLTQQIKNICEAAGFNLTNFASHKIEVMKSIPEEHCRKNLRKEKYKRKDHYVCYETLKQIHLDSIYPWRISQQEREVCYLNWVQCMIHLVWHHHFKRQDVPRKHRWNDTVSDEAQKVWTKWRVKLAALEEIGIQRCIKQADFGKAVEGSIHHFSNISKDEYRQVSYMRLVNNLGAVYCVLQIGKVREWAY